VGKLVLPGIKPRPSSL